MIDLLANTRSTAFVESAFRLLEIQSIRNSRIPLKSINLISISADFNQEIYSIYAEIPLTVVPNPIDNSPKLEVEDVLQEYAMEEYGTNDNILGLFTSIAFEVEIEEASIEDPEYEYAPLEFPIIEFDLMDFGEDVQVESETIEFSVEYFGIDISLINFNNVFTDIPAQEDFYTDPINDLPFNPKNIETFVDIEEMKVFVSATIPFFASVNNQGEIKITPLDYL